MTSKKILIGLVAVSAFAILLVASVRPLHWRAEVLLRYATGNIKDVTLQELLDMLRPHSGFSLQSVLNGEQLSTAIQDPFTSSEDVKAGAMIFQMRCSKCHGSDARGATAPSLSRLELLRHGSSDWSMFRNIRHGIPGTGMVPTGLSFHEAWRVVAFLKSIQFGSGVSVGTGMERDEKSDLFSSFRDVTPMALINADRDGAEWRMYSRTYNGWRFSPLAQINAKNVGALRLRWIRQLKTSGTRVEAAPIVVNGIMFITEPPGTVLALDASNGKVLWAYRRELPDRLSLCCGAVNRGVAVLGDRVYVGTLDAHLVALDVRTGTVAWDIKVADPGAGYSITGAPLAVGGMIVTGVSGGEFGIRGFLQAVDARTGKLRWRFYTVPGIGDGPGDAHGGGPTWITGSFDAELNILYWGVGNPSPPFSGDRRPGDNLYTDSVIALDASTGKLRWHFQFTPHDEHDWDANQVPLLASIESHGGEIPVIAWANRNGFYYVLDRRDGRFIAGVPFVEQTWAKGLDRSGRPILNPSGRVSVGGTFAYPGISGGVNWQSPAFNPDLGLVFVHANETPSVFTKSDDPVVARRPYEMTLASGTRTEAKNNIFVRALRIDTGQRVWQYHSLKGEYKSWSGLLATKGNLVFGAAAERLFALNARTGDELWSVQVGGQAVQGPISFSDGGDQLIVFIAGRDVIAFSL